MVQARIVEGEEFRELLLPGADALVRLAAAGRAHRGAHSLPEAASVAMRERFQEPRFAGEWDDEPVVHTHVLAGILAFAAEDHLLTMAHAFRAEYTPLFAGDTLARAVLESAGRSRWLMEVPLSVEARLAVGISIEIQSRGERLGYDDTVDTGQDAVRAEMSELKAARKALKLKHEDCPRNMAAIEFALGEGKTGHFGDTVGRMLAGVAHGELYALIKAFITADAITDPLTGTLSAPIAADLSELYRSMLLAAIGYKNLLIADVQLFGWPSPELANTAWLTLDTLADNLPGIPREHVSDPATLIAG